jgi:hypothetical protein
MCAIEVVIGPCISAVGAGVEGAWIKTPVNQTAGKNF